MKSLLAVALLFTIGACLDNPADYESTEQELGGLEYMDGPRVGIGRERYCDLLKEEWKKLEKEKDGVRGCRTRYCIEFIYVIVQDQYLIEQSWRWNGCYGSISQ